MHARVVLGVGKGVLFREVSSVQECPHRERGSTVHTIDTRHNTLGFLPVGRSVYEAFAAGPMSQLSGCYHPPMQDCTRRDYSKIRKFEFDSPIFVSVRVDCAYVVDLLKSVKKCIIHTMCKYVRRYYAKSRPLCTCIHTSLPAIHYNVCNVSLYAVCTM